MITVVVVFIIDISGAVDSAKKAIWRVTYGALPYRDISIKPLDCSLCTTFWTILAHLIFIRSGIIESLFIASIMAFSAEIIKVLLLLSKDLIISLFELLTKKIGNDR